MDYGELRRMIKRRRYRMEPILNIEEASEGAPLQIVGYTLIGPCGSRHRAIPHPKKGYCRYAVRVWFGGIDYAAKKRREQVAAARATP